MKNDKRLSTKGKTVFVGIDVHKTSYSIAGVCDGVKVGGTRLPANYEALTKTLHRLFPGAILYTAYEAGFSGFRLHRYLANCGIHNIVVNPASILIKANDKVKTDKRDATAIASQMAAGLLSSITIPTQKLEETRAMSRFRDDLVRDRTKCINRIKSKLHQFGLMTPELDGIFSKKRRVILKELIVNSSESLQWIFNAMLRNLENVELEIKNVEQKLAEQASHDEKQIFLRSIPGFGPVTSSVVANEIGDFKRFDNGRQLASYCGLTPREHSSGDKTRRGAITKQGSSLLRKVLVEASWRAVKHDPTLKAKFETLSHRCGKRRTIVAIARHLLIRARACVLNRELYRIETDRSSLAIAGNS